ncbi:hypothetical protein [Nonomuraea dietziae]|uniref:hypothetical protein n=1 Tax=Nonomuraea dietziae TaxID=65515 RepID=UPI0031D0A381
MMFGKKNLPAAAYIPNLARGASLAAKSVGGSCSSAALASFVRAGITEADRVPFLFVASVLLVVHWPCSPGPAMGVDHADRAISASALLVGNAGHMAAHESKSNYPEAVVGILVVGDLYGAVYYVVLQLALIRRLKHHVRLDAAPRWTGRTPGVRAPSPAQPAATTYRDGSPAAFPSPGRRVVDIPGNNPP